MRLEARNISFGYDRNKVLKDISIKAGSGELIAFLGPNGVGKSTLFRCFLGFLRPQSGSVLAEGRDVFSYSRKELARQIAYIPQSYSPAFNHTVLDTVLMGITSQIGLFDSPGKKEIEKAREVLRSLGMEGMEERGSMKISGGERQLMLLARALLQDARILIMDEPTANLDYRNSFLVMERVMALRDEGYTILFSTHDPNQALRYASRSVAIKDGHVIADGRPEDVIDRSLLENLYGIRAEISGIRAGGKDISVCTPYEAVR